MVFADNWFTADSLTAYSRTGAWDVGRTLEALVGSAKRKAEREPEAGPRSRGRKRSCSRVEERSTLSPAFSCHRRWPQSVCCNQTCPCGCACDYPLFGICGTSYPRPIRIHHFLLHTTLVASSRKLILKISEVRKSLDSLILNHAWNNKT